MTTKSSILAPIELLPGIQPETDCTAASTKYWTYGDKVRFQDGRPEKIGGWQSIAIKNNDVIEGVARTLYSGSFNGRFQTIIGTNTKLYSYVLNTLTNITPLQTTGVAIASSLATDYGALGSNPFSATNGSRTVTVADSNASLYQVNYTVTFTGATGFAGIPAGDLNTEHRIISIGSGTYTIRVATAATSTASGGGASVVRATGRIRVTAASHGQSDGDRVKITGAATTGGVLNTEINAEHIIRNVAAGTFDIMTSGTATSSVTGGGGASTEYFKQIPVGLQDEISGQGYGLGLYGLGLYGVPKTSATLRGYPRIWFVDRYGDYTIATPGNQGAVYQWDQEVAEAPVAISGAPSAVNYAFISDNVLVTFGAGAVENKIFASDQGDITQWVASSTNSVFEDNIEGAGRLICHLPVFGQNLIFSETRTYSMRFIGRPLVWEIQLKEPSIGIISPFAKASANGVGFWMALDNFYMWRGGDVEVIPANGESQCTCLNYVFGDLNYGQKSKIFAWYNREYNEVWFHYPSADSQECNRVVRVNIKDFSWSIDTLDRTAAEAPNIVLGYPRLINNGVLYQHEIGSNDDGSPMAWELHSNLRNGGKDNVVISGLIPDSIQTGTMQATIKGKLFPQSVNFTYNKTYNVAPTTERVPTSISARYYQYVFSGDELDQSFIMGMWQEYIQKGAGN